MTTMAQTVFKRSLFLGCLFLVFTGVFGSTCAAGNRFLVLDNGTVKDQKNGLIWAAQDNGADILWSKGAPYCEKYSEGGKTDWRMPSSEELATLYGNKPKVKGQDYKDSIDVVTTLIKITSPWVWTERRTAKNKAIAFGFNYGVSRRLYRGSMVNRRVLPVRSGR